MSEQATTTTPETTEAPAKKPARKPKTKPSKTIATETVSGNGKPPSTALRKPMIRILQALAKAGETGLYKEEVVKRAKLASDAWASEYLGKKDGKLESSYGFQKLVPGKLVRTIDVDGRNSYHITGAGKKALERAEKASA